MENKPIPDSPKSYLERNLHKKSRDNEASKNRAKIMGTEYNLPAERKVPQHVPRTQAQQQALINKHKMLGIPLPPEILHHKQTDVAKEEKYKNKGRVHFSEDVVKQQETFPASIAKSVNLLHTKVEDNLVAKDDKEDGPSEQKLEQDAATKNVTEEQTLKPVSDSQDNSIASYDKLENRTALETIKSNSKTAKSAHIAEIDSPLPTDVVVNKHTTWAAIAAMQDFHKDHEKPDTDNNIAGGNKSVDTVSKGNNVQKQTPTLCPQLRRTMPVTFTLSVKNKQPNVHGNQASVSPSSISSNIISFDGNIELFKDALNEFVPDTTMDEEL